MRGMDSGTTKTRSIILESLQLRKDPITSSAEYLFKPIPAEVLSNSFNGLPRGVSQMHVQDLTLHWTWLKTSQLLLEQAGARTD